MRAPKIGSDGPNFKGGRIITFEGYIHVLVPGERRYRLEHRVVMERYLGRKLKKEEQVHHKNRDKTDNRIENLQILNIREHARMHAIEKVEALKIILKAK